MTRLNFFSTAILFLLLSCCGTKEEGSVVLENDLEEKTSSEVVLPVDEYFERCTVKPFGKYVSDRFIGYHAADDIEYTDIAEEVPVYAIADGIVLREGWASGYGGLLTVKFTIDGREVTALYGHLDLSSSTLVVGQEVEQGQFLADLGDGESSETDGERKHLHFALYEGSELRTAGYVQSEAELAEWINPSVFFESVGLRD